LGDVYPGTAVRNHEWWKPETFANLGTIPSARIEELSEGRMSGDVEVLLNRAVADHDIALVVGPVLPHEVVGMSGGNKYFFPGVAGVNLGYRDPATIDVADFTADAGTLVVPRAGEVLFRLR
jgi:lactate racemase